MEHTAEMPFLDHLEELRWRIIWSLVALMIGVIAGFVIVLNFDLLTWLQAPVTPFLHGHKLVVTHPGEGFSIMLQTAVVIGTVMALPVIIYQVWLFLSPALHRHEKKVVVPVILGSVFLFVCGAALAWFFVLPMTLRFLFSFADRAFEEMIKVDEYFGFVMTLVLCMGAVFELPIVIMLLTAMGLVKPRFLSKFRRHAVVASYVAASIITPGDLVYTSVILTIPLYMLYEISIGLSWIVYRKREKKRIADEAEEVIA